MMESDDSSRIGKRVIYQGHVQGVGFRYTVNRIARRFGVVGYVRNQADGTVELIVEGGNRSVTNFLEEISQAFHDHIRGQTAEPHESGEAFDRFGICF